MMNINFITGFPTFFCSPLETSILKKAKKKGIVSYNVYDLKEYTLSKHKKIDDEPFSGKPGMILKPEPFFRVMEHLEKKYSNNRIVYCCPEGRLFNQDLAKEFAEENTVTFLCGHFKGIDARVLENFSPERVSIGNYIVTGGELASLVIVDAFVRLKKGVLNTQASAKTDSFEDCLLDCDYYTRPASYRGNTVPSVLLSGNHKQIKEWKRKNKVERTKRYKPELITKN